MNTTPNASEDARAQILRQQAAEAAALRADLETYFAQDAGRFARLERLAAARGISLDAVCLHLVQQRSGQHADNPAAWICVAAQRLVCHCGGAPTPKDHQRLREARQPRPPAEPASEEAAPPPAPAPAKTPRRGGKADPAPPPADS